MKKLTLALALAAAAWILPVQALTTANEEAKALYEKGLAAMRDVLGGDTTRFTEALRNIEESRAKDPGSIDTLYLLARAYFYQGITHNQRESLDKARTVAEEILSLKPANTEALSFHGSVLTGISRGADLAMFMKGVGEMNRAVETDSQNANNRLVRALTASNFPPQALAAMGNYDPLRDMEFVRDQFRDLAFYYAPHAQVVTTALVGDMLISRGRQDDGAAQLKAALALPRPAASGDRAGRIVLDGLIQARLDGGSKPLVSGLMGSCYSCHLNAPDKLMPRAQ